MFDKTGYSMMQEFQVALFINTTDLVMTHIVPSAVRGYQWVIHQRRNGAAWS